MSCIVTENFYFAIRKDTQEPVHISQMLEKDRGIACNCICASCRRTLIAKLGRGKRIRHFAHKSEGVPILDCSAQKANESGLHKMAKAVISIYPQLKSALAEILIEMKTIPRNVKI